ncbi:MAG: hypothetical protein H8E44_19945 [Planctomycetes bacterium]|nr:hypothetical protein [Planctomycetota bacterium]MBL7037816.1 hypothetical protein [Pirellulaceae bacterium]
MSTRRMAAVVRAAGLSGNDQRYFPPWLASYCRFCGLADDVPVPIDRTQVIAFLFFIRYTGGKVHGGKR